MSGSKNGQAANDPAAPPASPGLGSLLKGKRDASNVFAPQDQAAPGSSRRGTDLIPAWYFFAADVLLIAAALIVFARSSGPLTFGQAAFYIIDLSLAAVLGSIGVRQTLKARDGH